jgi:hypothetical protein
MSVVDVPLSRFALRLSVQTEDHVCDRSPILARGLRHGLSRPSWRTSPAAQCAKLPQLQRALLGQFGSHQCFLLATQLAHLDP